MQEIQVMESNSNSFLQKTAKMIFEFSIFPIFDRTDNTKKKKIISTRKRFFPFFLNRKLFDAKVGGWKKESISRFHLKTFHGQTFTPYFIWLHLTLFLFRGCHSSVFLGQMSGRFFDNNLTQNFLGRDFYLLFAFRVTNWRSEAFGYLNCQDN